MSPRARLIALGASNLTRGFLSLVDGARHAAHGPVEVLAALGHGRSYGIASTLLGRTLPGIDGCGLWHNLAGAQPLPTTALLMDVGNDLLYGVEVPTILGWVERALVRVGPGVNRVVAELPLHNLRRLGPARYTLFRSLLFPGCRLPLAAIQQNAEQLNAGLEELAARHGAAFCRLRREWYGFDPIHIRPRCWRAAFHELLGAHGAPAPRRGFGSQWVAGMQLWFARPGQRWHFGREQRATQPSLRWPDGTTVSIW